MNWLGPLLESPPPSISSRVRALQVSIGVLLASDEPEGRWVGARLQAWLARGGDLQAELGLRPVRGCRTTPQVLARLPHPDEARLGKIDGDIGSRLTP